MSRQSCYPEKIVRFLKTFLGVITFVGRAFLCNDAQERFARLTRFGATGAPQRRPASGFPPIGLGTVPQAATDHDLIVMVTEVLERLGGYAWRYELVAMGCDPMDIDMTLYYRKIIRVRVGQYASVGTAPVVLRALAVGGRLACVSALAFHQGCDAEVDPVHVLVKYGASRLGPRPPGKVVVHWARRTVDGSRMVVSEAAARAQAARCSVRPDGTGGQSSLPPCLPPSEPKLPECELSECELPGPELPGPESSEEPP
jgi:hypothetical protein